MVFICPLCCEAYIITTYLCDDCNRIKRLRKIYGNCLVTILESVLLVKPQGAENKIIKLKKEMRTSLEKNKLLNNRK